MQQDFIPSNSGPFPISYFPLIMKCSQSQGHLEFSNNVYEKNYVGFAMTATEWVRLAASAGLGRGFGTHRCSRTCVSFGLLLLWGARLLWGCLACWGCWGTLLLGWAVGGWGLNLGGNSGGSRRGSCCDDLLLLQQFLLDDLRGRGGACRDHLDLRLSGHSSCSLG